MRSIGVDRRQRQPWQNRPVPDDAVTATARPSAPSVPQWTPGPRELDDLDLLVKHAFDPPLNGFTQPSSTAEELSVTLATSAEAAEVATAVGQLELVDPEGAPLALLTVTGTWPAGDGRVGLAGPVTLIAPNVFGPFRRLYLSPGEVHRDHPADTLLGVAVRRPLSRADIARIDEAAREHGKTALLLVCAGHGMAQGVSGPALVRATRAAAAHVEAPTVVVVVAAADRGDEAGNERLLARVARAYAPETIVLATVEPGAEEVAADLPEDVAAIVSTDRPARDRQGVVFFFTGLSGSGKSTLARALTDSILERGERTVTSLDGDVVRHHLSKGLGFSREDRETNILRIGFVAAEISRHGGVGICSPIAPFEATRAEVRRMVQDAGGGFVLIYVATPLEECERRDRKGLYAKARAGIIPDFTGISSPYEEPADALKVDTTDRDIAECLEEIVDALTVEGWLRP